MKSAASDSHHAADTERLKEIIAAFRGRRILVVGDIILDRYLWGDVERTSPEAPVPVVRVRNETFLLGGAANVISNLAALGGSSRLVGIVAGDEQGRKVRQLLDEMNVPSRGLVEAKDRPTTIKTRVMAMNQQLLRLDREETRQLDKDSARRLLASFKKELASAEVVILSDYGKGVLADDLCREMIRLAKKSGKKIVVDPKGTDYAKYRGADVIKPNKREMQEAAGISVDIADGLARAAKKIQSIVRAQAIVVSRGSEGVSVFEQRRSPVHISAQARSVYDVTGAGDTFIAAMSLALALGAGVSEAAQLGNVAGSIVVGKLGAATAEPSELLKALDPGWAGHKLRTATQIRQELQPLRAAGKRIVFTNGCFDLIHLGHIKFLEQARRLGDILVVAINSDRSVHEIKGPPRPVLEEEERAAILAALDSVDFVVIFDEATPERLLAQLRPDILVKGKGLRAEEVVGRRIVEGYGGKVALLPLLGEVVTDSMLEKIARQAGKRSARV